MDEIQLLRTLDPVTAENVDAFPALEVFEQLSAQLAEVPAGAARTATPIGDVRRRPERGGHRLALRSLAGAVAVAAVALAASLALTESVAPSPRWAFAGEINPTWAQVPGRSSPGILTCPSATTCYATGPKSVEVTRDGGHTWHHALAQGGMLLSRVACSSAADCAFLESGPRGKPLFVETADTGKTWTSHPGPAGLSMDHQLTKRFRRRRDGTVVPKRRDLHRGGVRFRSLPVRRLRHRGWGADLVGLCHAFDALPGPVLPRCPVRIGRGGGG